MKRVLGERLGGEIGVKFSIVKESGEGGGARAPRRPAQGNPEPEEEPDDPIGDRDVQGAGRGSEEIADRGSGKDDGCRTCSECSSRRIEMGKINEGLAAIGPEGTAGKGAVQGGDGRADEAHAPDDIPELLARGDAGPRRPGPRRGESGQERVQKLAADAMRTSRTCTVSTEARPSHRRMPMRYPSPSPGSSRS